jgi:hypothetical protein
MRQVRERFARCRIDDLFATTAVAVIPLTVDIGAELRVHGCPRLLFLQEWIAGIGFPNE